MTDDKKLKADLDTAISALRNDEPDAKEVAAAGNRIWARIGSDEAVAVEEIHGCADVQALLPAYRAGTLTAARILLVRAHLHECVACRNLAESGVETQTTWTPLPAAPRWGFRQWALATAVLVVLGVSGLLLDSWYFAVPPGMRAKVQSVSGKAYRMSASGERVLAVGDELSEGDIVRTAAGSHAFLALRDGSIVEMNERAEFFVSARRNDTTVNLDQGNIIVQAAKRRSGHLYVITPDCRVAVTGTVFAVNSGMKGSRVSVIEGAVRVSHSGSEELLHPGEQVVTSASMGEVPVQDEIAWSSELDKHLALLAQFATLQKKFEQIPTPGLRFTSNILPRVPANTVVYVTIPNLGDALTEANRIFQEQLQQSSVLREWWYAGHKGTGPELDQVIAKIHALSQYLGDEVVVAGLSGTSGGESNAVIMAEVRREGLGDFLRTEFAALDPTNPGGGIQVVDQAQLATMPVGTTPKIVALVRPDLVLFSGSVATLQVVNAHLNAASGAFTATDFGQRIESAYRQGAGFLLAADIQQLIAVSRQRSAQTVTSDLQFQRSGFGDMKYVFVSHREVSGVPDNRAVLEFAGARYGIASWLAKPAPMGSLEFVSANAGLAISGIGKNPAAMLDDILLLAGDANSSTELAKFETESGINLKTDLAAAFGGEATVALDGPILPKPSWKFIAEVTDASRLQNSIQRLVQVVNQHAVQEGKPGMQLETQEANGRQFYLLRSLDPAKLGGGFYYTFAGSYIVVAPTRELVANALAIQASPENSLARSGEFRSLMPKDAYADSSAVMYQNLAPMLQPIASQLSPDQLQSLQQLAQNSKPTVVCAYGGENRIELATSSRMLFNPNLMAMAALLGHKQSGTLQQPRP